MGFFSDMFSPGSVMSGGLTFTNDNLMKALGTQKGDTLFAVNDALKHGPIETSMEKGRPANFSELEGDRANRLGADKTGVARGIGDIAALVGLAYGGAAAMGGGGAGGGGSSAGTAANTGSSSSMWPQLIKSGAQMLGNSGGNNGGMMGGLMGMGGQQQKPQFDTNAWLKSLNEDQKRMLLAQNLKASNPQSPPDYSSYA